MSSIRAAVKTIASFILHFLDTNCQGLDLERGWNLMRMSETVFMLTTQSWQSQNELLLPNKWSFPNKLLTSARNDGLLCKFRGDCQSLIDFFTPQYAKRPYFSTYYFTPFPNQHRFELPPSNIVQKVTFEIKARGMRRKIGHWVLVKIDSHHLIWCAWSVSTCFSIFQTFVC